SQQGATRNREKAIVNSLQPIYDQEPSMVAEDDETSKDKEIDKLMALISLSFKKIYKPTNNNLRTSSNTSRANHDNSLRINRSAGYENQRIGNVAGARETVGSTVVQKSRIQCYNCKEFRHVARECQKSKRAKDAAYHREKMLLCKQEETGIQLNTEQADWKDDTDDDELEAHYILSETNNLLYADYKKSEAELARRNSKEYASQMELECTKVREMKDKLSAHQETISILSQQKEAQIKLYKTQEDKELDKVIELEHKVKKAQRANPSLYDIGCYNDNLALMLAPDFDEVIRLEKESRSKLSDLIRPFDYDKLNNLYDLFVPQREKSSEQHYFLERSRLSHINVNNRKSKEDFNKQTTLLEKRMDESIPLDKQYEVTNLQCDYLELLEKCEGLETELSKSKMMSKSFESVQKHAINLELELQQCKEKIKNDMLFKVNQTKYFCKEREQYFEIQDLKAQLQDKGIAIRVIPTTSVSRPQLKSNPQRDRVMHNNSQGKKQEVEDQHRSVKLSKNKTSVTACNDNSNAKTLNVKSVSAMCDKCVLIDEHAMCVLNSVAKPIKKTVASESNKEPRNFTRKLYEHVSKTCSWWYSKFTPSGYKWKPKSEKENVNSNVNMSLGNASRTANVMDTMTSRYSTVSNTPLSSNSFAARKDCPIHVDSGCSKHMTGNLKLLINFVEKFLGTVKFGNDQIAPSHGYGDLVQGAIMIKRVYYVEGINHNLFFVGQFCNADLKVAFRKSTCFIRDLKENDLLTGSRGTNLYSITLQDTNCPNPICLMAKATSSQAWLVQRGLQAQVSVVRTDKGTEFLNQTLHAYFAAEWILYQTSITRTPEQNGIVERRNRTLVEAARTMLSAAKVPLFFWAEAIATACFTQNRSLVIPRHEKTPYHIINDWKPSVKFFYIFGSICYIVRDGENLNKMKEKGDECIFVGYSNKSRAYRVFNKRTRVIMESIHVNFDELPQMASDHISSDPAPECQTMALKHDSLSPVIQRQENVSQADRTITTSNELDLLFSMMFDELLNGSSKVVSKSSAVSATDAPNQRQHHTTPLNNHTTPAPTFIGNPSQSVRTRRQLESDAEMCMFVLTISRTEPKNIKEAMADSAWIESMQEELHQFDRLDV
nr:integrase, catalytic region, zinc finger, CCHC-type, peptidase aspartic, catalytic [Tanacetum cinerariifolium]